MRDEKRGLAAPFAGRVVAQVAVQVVGGVLILLALAQAPARAAEDEPGHLKLSAGAIGALPTDGDVAGYFSFEYRAGPSWEFWHVRPSFGVAATTDAALYGWTALNLDIFFSQRIVLTPSTGVGLYAEGDGQDLGSAVLFRNGAELAWRLDDLTRVGIGVHYLANFGIGDEDPGTTTMTVFYAHPLHSLLP
jgi:hypothetical protein